LNEEWNQLRSRGSSFKTQITKQPTQRNVRFTGDDEQPEFINIFRKPSSSSLSRGHTIRPPKEDMMKVFQRAFEKRYAQQIKKDHVDLMWQEFKGRLEQELESNYDSEMSDEEHMADEVLEKML